MQQTPDRAKLGRNTPVRRLITGLWQMADQERDGKPFDLDAAAEALRDYARAGFDTFDMADHYGNAEIVAGMVHNAMRLDGETPPTILTKWCPEPGPMTAGVVRRGVETALERLQVPSVDVMQFHWWRYESPEYLGALEHLMRLREEGLIREIGLTNFDAAHLRMVVRNGIDIASNQVCFSLLDRRAAGDLSDVARAHDLGLLAFGTGLRYALVTRLGERVVADIRMAVFDRVIGLSPGSSAWVSAPLPASVPAAASPATQPVAPAITPQVKIAAHQPDDLTLARQALQDGDNARAISEMGKLAWRIVYPDKETKVSANEVLAAGLAELETVRRENAEMRAAYVAMQRKLRELEKRT